MRKSVTLVLGFALLAALALPAEAGWSYFAESNSQLIMCSGEVSSAGAPSCSLTSSWGTSVMAHTFQGLCTATVVCPNGLARTCQAVEAGGGTPGDPWEDPFCYASSTSTGIHQAVCKSDLGWSLLRCS